MTDAPTWLLVVGTLLSAITPMLVGYLTIRHGKIEREKAKKAVEIARKAQESQEREEEFRQEFLEEIQELKASHKEYTDTQRSCQLSLPQNYRSKTAAEKDWDKQNGFNMDLHGRVTSLESLVRIPGLLPIKVSRRDDD